MKIVLVIVDESWAWVWHELNLRWECWYEEGQAAARRVDFLDRAQLEEVNETILHLITNASAFNAS